MDKDTIRGKIIFRDVNQLIYSLKGEKEERAISWTDISNTKLDYASLKTFDIVTRKSGQQIKGIITGESNEEIYITITENHIKIPTYIAQSDVATVRYGSNEIRKKPEAFDTGFGVGLEYGGIGGNFAIYPVKAAGFFAGLGYTFKGLGYNLGIKFRAYNERSTSKVMPFAIMMYGHTAVVVVDGASNLSKKFSGGSIGGGIDIQPNLKKTASISIALIVPLNTPEINDYVDTLSNSGVKFKNTLLPIRISLGFKI